MNVPSFSHELPSIISGTNKIGNLFSLFSWIVKLYNSPFSIASSVLTGSNNIPSSGIPLISLELLNSKDLYEFAEFNPIISQLKSACVGFSVLITSSLRLQFASLKVGSIVPSSKIKYMNKIIFIPLFKGFVVKP